MSIGPLSEVSHPRRLVEAQKVEPAVGWLVNFMRKPQKSVYTQLDGRYACRSVF